jgi:hypothetical protein
MNGSNALQAAENEKIGMRVFRKRVWRSESLGGDMDMANHRPTYCQAAMALDVIHCAQTACGVLLQALASVRESAAAFFS